MRFPATTTTGRLQRNAESAFSKLRRETAGVSPERVIPEIGAAGGPFSPTRGGRDRKEGGRQDRAILSGMCVLGGGGARVTTGVGRCGRIMSDGRGAP